MNKTVFLFGAYRDQAYLRRLLWIVAVAVVVCVAAVSIVVWAVGPDEKVDWQLQGYYVDSNGTVIETLQFPVSGKIHDHKDGFTQLQLHFGLPEDFRYIVYDAELLCHRDTFDRFGYYVLTAFSDIQGENAMPLPRVTIALDVEAGFAIFQWEDDPTKFLVASTSGADPEQIRSHFQKFIVAHSN